MRWALTQRLSGETNAANAEAYQVACLAGLGMIQAPFVGVRGLIAQIGGQIGL